MPDNWDDPVDNEARRVHQMLKDGDRAGAARRLQDDAAFYRPGQFTELCGELKGMQNLDDTLTHIEMTPVPGFGDDKGKIDVSLVTPAIDRCGRQYIDQDGRPMAFVDPIAQVDNTKRAEYVVCRPPIAIEPPPCRIERPWIRLDEHRERVRFDIRLPNFGLDVQIGGGGHPHWEPRPPFGDRPYYGGGNNGGWRRDGGNYPRGNDTRVNNNTTIINETHNTTINRTTVKNETNIKNETNVKNETHVRGNANVHNETKVRVEQHVPVRPQPHQQPQDQQQQHRRR